MEMMILVGLMFAMILFMVWISVNFYKKCPPNAAMIISGMMAGVAGRQYKIVVGGGAVTLPLIQQVNYLSLETFNVDVKSATSMPSSDNIPLIVSGVAQIKVKGDDLSIATAAETMLGKEREEIPKIAQQIFLSSLRHVIASLPASNVVKQPDSVSEYTRESAICELSKMGLTVVSFSILEIRDEVGYLDLLAREQVERKRQEVQG